MNRNTGRYTGKNYHSVVKRDYKGLLNEPKKKGFFGLVTDFLRGVFGKSKPKEQVPRWSQTINHPYRNSSYNPYGQSQFKIEDDKPKYGEVFGAVFGFVGALIGSLFAPFIAIWNVSVRRITKRFRQTDIFRIAFTCAFLIIALKFADLQVFSNTQLFRTQTEGNSFIPSVILAKRGQIKIKDLSQNKTDIPVTASHILSNVFFEPIKLQIQINNEVITLEQAAELISGGLNLEYERVYDTLKMELDREEVRDYAVLQKYITKTQRDAIEYLRRPDRDEEGNFVQPPLSSWLGHDTVEIRVYPENELLSSTLGFVPRYLAPREDALQSGCADLVKRNEDRGTGYNGYVIGNYGLEQKFCSELGGVNGLSLFAQDVGTETEDAQRVQHGSDLYLTIDINLQRKAEEVLEKAIKDATNKLGGPKDGSAIVMEAETGKILAMASAPTYDPNEYNKANPAAFRNASTNGDYEVGSVMKPLTVAATVNDYQIGKRDSEGNRIGTGPEWTFEDFDSEGKVYIDNNGYEFKIQNANGFSYQDMGEVGLSQILRDSINTGIAEIIPTIGNERLKNYFLERFKVGVPTHVNMPGDSHGYYQPLLDEKNLYSDFVYATFGFGQGFTMSPIQLLRSYTPLANEGVIVEPYMVEKIVNQDGVEQELPEREADTKVIEPTTARLVTGYLVNTIDQGYLGKQPSKGQVPGYSIAGKTGTAEVGRSPENPCGNNISIYACNRNQGIYDHTFIGYGPEKDPKYIVLVKLSEPQPGVIENYAENTLGPSFSELMQYTLEYNQIPKDR